MSETYKQHVHHSYTEALLSSAKQHLTMDGAMKVSHLSSEDRAIGGKTCREAFLDTFSQKFLAQMEIIKNEYGDQAVVQAVHGDLQAALHGFTQDVVNKLGGHTPLSRMGLSAHEIIESHF